MLWYANGREATRAEVQASITSGYPHLLKLAETDGQEAIDQLNGMVRTAFALLPIV